LKAVSNRETTKNTELDELIALTNECEKSLESPLERSVKTAHNITRSEITESLSFLETKFTAAVNDNTNKLDSVKNVNGFGIIHSGSIASTSNAEVDAVHVLHDPSRFQKEMGTSSSTKSKR
jgi:hypothetical protein